MAENKKSFVLYCDLIHTVKELSLTEAGKLFKHLYKYVNDEDPELEDILIQLAFEPIKQQLKRDLKKYEGKKDERSIAGRIGNLKRYQLDLHTKYENGELTLEEAESIAKDRKVSLSEKVVANVAVNDNVNVNDTVNVNDINKKEIPAYSVFLEYALEKKPRVNQDDLKLKYSSWIENGWKDGNNKKIVNWKSKLLNTLPFLKEDDIKRPVLKTIDRNDFFTNQS